MEESWGKRAATGQAAWLRWRIQVGLIGFVAALVVSGLTAFPLVWEVTFLQRWLGASSALGPLWPALAAWIDLVARGLLDTQRQYPFLFYGTDWLAFAHLVIALAFWGPLRDPVRNVWVVEFAMLACVLIVPMVLIFGPLRGIPPFWRVLDAAFGVVGLLPLAWVRRDIHRLERLAAHPAPVADAPTVPRPTAKTSAAP